MKAFQVDDETIFAANDASHAAQLYQDWCGDPCSDGYPAELTDEQLDHRHPAFDADERPIKGETESAREWLAAATEPGFLAGPAD